jgi:hypothetical protein
MRVTLTSDGNDKRRKESAYKTDQGGMLNTRGSVCRYRGSGQQSQVGGDALG